MRHGTLNLGILAHVDAGKTTLTERLLHAAGVIDEIGSVDAGTTQTDFLELERQRGITIRSAVVSFPIDDVSVNVIDTPGHPDFIAEVERALSVLDGAVLVISAVEGVQPQTRVLMRALQRLRVPTLLFVNKIDRGGAGDERVLGEISRRLSPAIVPMGRVDGLGTRAARFTAWGAGDPEFRTGLTETLATGDDALLTAYVEDESAITYRRLRAELAAQSRLARVHPVYFGSAITGEGVGPLMGGLVELLPVAAGDVDGPVSGRTFKIERGPTGEKVAYVRMFTGTVRTRDRLRTSGADEKVTAVSVFDNGAWLRRAEVRAGEIGKLWGLTQIQVGDTIGEACEPITGPGGDRTGQPMTKHFAPPTLETVVVPVHAAETGPLRVALAKLAEQDPLINVRQDDSRHEISVSLYGEVQKEVIQATLAGDFGIDVTFRETTVICIERPARTGEAIELLHGDGNPFLATIGLRVDPAPAGSGVEFRLRVDGRTVPIYVFKNADLFADVMGGYVRRAMREGLSGWAVSDSVVTMTRCGYSSPDGPPSTRGPLSTAADFRNLTPIVLMRALADAGTVVCEPVVRAGLEIPATALGPVLTAVGRLGGAVRRQSVRDGIATVEAVVPAARVYELQGRLPGLTAGEGVLESAFGGYQPVRGEAPVRLRTTADPRNREEYLMYLSRQGAKV